MTRFNRTEIAVFLLIVVCTLGFAAFTNNAWEDWYITYRASKNLAIGNGLVFWPGQHTHSFTSPIGTLIPAWLNMLVRNSSDDLVLWLYRFVSALFLGATGVLLLRLARNLALGLAATIFMLGCFIFDAKTSAYSINGMETAFLVFFVALTVYALRIPTRNPSLLLGICWGGLMWTRPDGFVYAGSIALGFLVFPAAADAFPEGRKSLFMGYVRAAGIGLLTYLPWVLWAWSFYGTPVPHTIIAKGLHGQSVISAFGYKVRHFAPWGAFLPPYWFMGGWGSTRYLFALMLIGLLAWLFPKASPVTRALSLSYVGAVFYMFLIVPTVYPWYLPPVVLLGFMAHAALLQDTIKWLDELKETPGWQRGILSASRFVLMIPMVVQVVLWFCVAYQLRLQQQIIENGNRKQIGLWLKENAKSPNDTVMMECLGYIGFFSNLKTYDYPGMSSPESVAARRTLTAEEDKMPSVFAPLMVKMQPDWVVLRPHEEAAVRQKDPHVIGELYVPVKVFDVCSEIQGHSWLPGRDFLLFDCRFTVFRRAK